ncbi:cobalt ABC transporter [Clostridium polyendosporum]|uniref:Cobalt ABC transporter n=1 Tax=Clostridium polyendosporum TaxID=69208 RepID=A0A919RY92_9CLOT|nr:ABC transporter ATP-binding protein [Clostridium polyendosporum]GIM27748.1 cobalt ABC transporter [Clostridium polyendosporum]
MYNDEIFELNHLQYSYIDEFAALIDINFKVKRGEKICILGANGSGKSTLLKILSGLYFPKEGAMKAFGEYITEENMEDDYFSKQYHRRVGFVFQNSDVQLFNSSVWDEIAFGPIQLGLKKEEIFKRVDDVMELFNISHLKERPPYRLSGGEKKKVALASILVNNPDALILDEPTNGLDPKSQRWLVNVLIQLNRAGKTIITSTHDLKLVNEIADRIIVLNEDHQIVADGAVDEILKNRELLLQVNLIDEYN